MGCDIHAFIEREVRGEWIMNSEPFDIGRNYNLFAILANVRNEDQRIEHTLPIKGLPFAASKELRLTYEYEKEKFYQPKNPSWVTIEELEEYVYKYGDPSRRHKDNLRFHVFEDLTEVIKGLRLFQYKDQPIRLVFWFDN